MLKTDVAALRWRPEETLDQLMRRLDDAVCEAMGSGGTVNEVDVAVSFTTSKTHRRDCACSARGSYPTPSSTFSFSPLWPTPLPNS